MTNKHWINDIWCEKLQNCYDIAYSESKLQKCNNRTCYDYAIFPKLLTNRVEKLYTVYEKELDFCFVGSFFFNCGQDIGYHNRKWVIKYSIDNFTSNSFFVNTTKNKGLNNEWKLLGDFDHTFDESYNFLSPKLLEDKNVFDESYYNIMIKSKFCLCPAGDLMWSMRFYEALLCRCIPIVDNVDETFRSEQERKIPYHFYLSNEKEIVYRQDWIDENLRLFYQYHTLSSG